MKDDFLHTSTIHVMTRNVNQDKQCLILIDGKLFPIKWHNLEKGKLYLYQIY